MMFESESQVLVSPSFLFALSLVSMCVHSVIGLFLSIFHWVISRWTKETEGEGV